MVWWKRRIVKLIDVVSLRKGEDVTDYRGTVKNMKDSLNLKGANLWILTCATLLTCVGLDLDSSTLLIGAMLISPLMNIVLAVGVFQAIRDWEHLIISFRNLSIAVFSCFIIGVVYFIIAPYGELTPALMSRSRPTLMDACIACIGGTAGIISYTRKEQLAAIPGVAISITLMPPICTISFAFTRFDWTLMWGAFYLFLINAIVIAATTTVIVSLLGFPTLRTITRRQRMMRLNLGLVGLVIFLLPSVFFLQDNISDKEDKERIQNFVEHRFPEDSLTTVRWELVNSDSMNIVKVIYQGAVIEDRKMDEYIRKFDSLKIANTRLQIVQPNINKNVVDHLAKTIDNLKDLKVVNNSAEREALKTELHLKFSDIRGIKFKGGTGDEIVAELEWKRARIFVLSRKQKLKMIKDLLQNRLGSDITVVEV